MSKNVTGKKTAKVKCTYTARCGHLETPFKFVADGIGLAEETLAKRAFALALKNKETVHVDATFWDAETGRELLTRKFVQGAPIAVHKTGGDAHQP